MKTQIPQASQQALAEVEKYLVSLGYPSASFDRGYRDEYAYLDLVVRQGEKAYIVVEVKSPKTFGTDTSWIDPLNLQFNPLVRQLQSRADNLNANYYLLSDGERFLWFRTDGTGRPLHLYHPVRNADDIESVEHHTSTLEVARLLEETWAKLYEITGIDPVEFVGMILLAKLQEEAGRENSLRELIERGELEMRLADSYQEEVVDLRRRLNPFVLEQLIADFGSTSLSQIRPVDLLSQIDHVLLDRVTNKSGDFRLPRWLTDFMLRLLDCKDDDVLIDIRSLYGDALAAASLAHNQTTVVSILADAKHLLWARVQEWVTRGSGRSPIMLAEAPPYGAEDEVRAYRPAKALVVPPIGTKLRTSRHSFFGHKDLENSEDVYMELALRWSSPGTRIVALLPDSFLFGDARRRFRDYLQGRANILATISLGAPFQQSGLNASIILLEVRGDGAGTKRHVFASRIRRRRDKKDSSFYFQEIAQLREVISAFESGTEYTSADSSTVCTWTPSDAVTPNSWLADHLFLEAKLHQQSSGYLSVYLPEIASIERGSSALKKVANGNQRLLGPGAIRPALLRSELMEPTAANTVQLQRKRVQVDDIVISLIGDEHAGDAALIDKESAGALANRHVAVVSMRTDRVIPAYLAIVLNSEFVRSQYRSLHTGALIKSLTLEALHNVKVQIPDMDVQRQVIQRFEELRKQVAENRAALQYIEGQFNSFLERPLVSED